METIVSGDDIITDQITYHFLDGEGNPYPFLNKAGETVTTQIIKDGESLQEVAPPGLMGEQAFNGWYYFENGTYGEEVKFGEPISVTETKDVDIKAHYGSVIYITFYQYAVGDVVLERKQVPKNEDGKYTFDMSTVSVPAPKTTLKFMGWSLTPGTEASEQDGDTVGSRPMLDNGIVEFTEDADVYPVYYNGIWITFISAEIGAGASYVPPHFLTADSTDASAAEPANPTMTGFAFDGWYTEEEGKNNYSIAEDNAHGEKFNFSTSFADLANYVNERGEVVLYGHWRPGDTTYVVVYWKQQVGNAKNAADSAKTYDYAGQTDPLTALTGSSPTPTAAQQRADLGFEYKRVRLTDGEGNDITGIAADGSSILNVYFDRKLIYFRFRTSTNASYNGNWTSSSYATTYTGLYGQTWSQAGYTTNWPVPNGTNRWCYYNSSNSITGMSYLGQFIPPDNVRDPNKVDVRFYYYGTSSYTVNLFLQNTDGTWPNTTNISGRTGGSFSLSDKLEGFVVSAYRVGNNGNWTNVTYTTNQDGTHNYSPASVTNIGTGPLNLRYARLPYEIKYLNPLNENPVLDSKTLLFGSALSSAKPADSVEIDLGVPGYEWDGNWYMDKACTVPFDFNSETMPLDGTKVYAGKIALYYYVKFDPNGGQLLTGQRTYSWFLYNQSVTTYDNIERNYIDYKGTGTPYYYYYDEFDISRRDEIWNYEYMADNPRTAYYTDSTVPADGAAFQPWLDTNTKYSYEADAYALIGWYDITDGNEEPFKSGTQVTRDTVLQAKWRRTGEYRVVYSVEAVDENGDPLLAEDGTTRVVGANSPSDGAKYADQSDSAILDKIGVVPSGYNFIGWFYDGTVYQPGDVYRIQARLSDENKNIYIYPVMEPVETVPVEVVSITFDPNGGTFTETADTEINAIIADITADETGTYAPKFEKNTDGTYSIVDLKLNEGLSLLSRDAVEMDEDSRLKEWNTKADGTGTAFTLDTKVGVDDLDPLPNVVYAIWEKCFKVYHSGVADGAIDKIWVSDLDQSGKYDITQKLTSGTIYGGYYSDYQNIGSVYTGGPDIWEADKAYTYAVTATGGGIGTAMTPVAGQTYYLKEVPDAYMQASNYEIYHKTTRVEKAFYFVTAVDDNNYQEVGFKIGATSTDYKSSLTEKISLTYTDPDPEIYDSWDSGELDVSSFNFNNVEAGYVAYVQNDKIITTAGASVTYRPYFKTFDGVFVYGRRQHTAKSNRKVNPVTFDSVTITKKMFW